MSGGDAPSTEAEIACFAHSGEVGVVVKLRARKSQLVCFMDAQQVTDRQHLPCAAEDASALVPIEDPCLLRRLDLFSHRRHGPGLLPGLGLRGVVAVSPAPGAVDGVLTALLEKDAVGGSAPAARAGDVGPATTRQQLPGASEMKTGGFVPEALVVAGVRPQIELVAHAIAMVRPAELLRSR